MNFGALLATLDVLVLERLPDGRVVRKSEPPTWCRALARPELLGEAPFELDDALPVLAALSDTALDDPSGVPTRSEFWTEIAEDGTAMHLEAFAVPIGGVVAFAVHRNDRLFIEMRDLLQRARELRMTHDTLGRETERRDVLVHAIVHDLAAPLHSILGVLSLLDEAPSGDTRPALVRTALGAATRMRELVGQILETFAAGREPVDADKDVDLAEIIDDALRELEPTARRLDVRVTADFHARPAVVVAERDRLVRVVINLVDNAMKHSPRGRAVRVHVDRAPDGVLLAIDDEGPGVSLELAPRLFSLLARGPARGSIGLGLYFCRISVERWGGTIGYATREGGGSRFWARLRAPDAHERQPHG